MASSSQDYAPGTTEASSPPPVTEGAQPKFNEEFDASQRGSSLADGIVSAIPRSNSIASQPQGAAPSRGGTLKKRNSLRKASTLRRSSSRRSIGAGSVRSLGLGDREKYEGADFLSAFNTPIPTKGSPTEILANRFQDWRRVLKDLITYFREVQKSHEARAKSLLSLLNLASNTTGPAAFRKEGGIGDATGILKHYHKQALAESNKAKSIEEDIMQQLTGLRSDLGQKIKEIKNLAGDFKNSCDKETDATRKAVRTYQESLGLVDTDPSATSGKGDPFIVRLAVERQIERQIDEENYLHKAFLNLEHSGRELESIVIGEIQKAYNAYAGILKREADEAYEAVESLRAGPIMMPKDTEWNAFVMDNDNFVDPRMPLRKPYQITYPGRDAPAAAEIRSGLLERKSKYLKSYTPGWYVLSPTHLHEYRSPDRLSTQTPVMSLYLQEQKLGSHSGLESSSHKFMLKGRQTGGMHRGHGWVFRAESRETMLEWYEDIKNLTEKTGMEREAFVRRHARSISGRSTRAGSESSDGAMDEDEADVVPYSATNLQVDAASPVEPKSPRPQPGGRFPSDLNVSHDLQMPLSNSSGASSNEHDPIAVTARESNLQHLPGSPTSGGRNQRPVSPRNPTETYRQESYQSHNDDIYKTGHYSANHTNRSRALSDRKAPAEAQPKITNLPSGTATSTVVVEPGTSVSQPEENSARFVAANVDTILTHDGEPSLPSAEAFLSPPEPNAPAEHRPSSPATMATTGTSLSDPELGSTEHLSFGVRATENATTIERNSLAHAESDPSLSQLQIPGKYGG